MPISPGNSDFSADLFQYSVFRNGFIMQWFQFMSGIALISLLRSVILSFLVSLFVNYAFAHRGVLDRDGCHIDEYNREYHCHRVRDSPPLPEPSQESETPNRRQDREDPDPNSWKNIEGLGYATLGVFSEIGLGFGEMNFQGADQTCLVENDGGLESQTCNLSARIMDIGAYGESKIGLFDIDIGSRIYSVIVGAEIGTAKTLGGKFYNCYDGTWDWLLDFDYYDQPERNRHYTCSGLNGGRRVSAGALEGYSYVDVKVGFGYVLPVSSSLFPGISNNDFGFLYLLAGKVEFSSDWGKYSKSEFGIGTDYHFSPNSSMRIKWTNRRLSFIVRGHF